MEGTRFAVYKHIDLYFRRIEPTAVFWNVMDFSTINPEEPYFIFYFLKRLYAFFVFSQYHLPCVIIQLYSLGSRRNKIKKFKRKSST